MVLHTGPVLNVLRALLQNLLQIPISFFTRVSQHTYILTPTAAMRHRLKRLITITLSSTITLSLANISVIFVKLV